MRAKRPQENELRAGVEQEFAPDGGVDEASPGDRVVFTTQALRVPQALQANLASAGLGLREVTLSQIAGSKLGANPLDNPVLVASLLTASRATIGAHWGVGCGNDEAGKRIADRAVFDLNEKIADGGAVALLEEDIQAIAEALDVVIIIGGSEGKQRDGAPALNVKQVFNPTGKKGIYILFADPVEGTNMMALDQPGAWTALALVKLPEESEAMFREAVGQSGKDMQEFLNDCRGEELARFKIPFCDDAYLTSYFARSPQPLTPDSVSPLTSPSEFLGLVASHRGVPTAQVTSNVANIALQRPRHGDLIRDAQQMEEGVIQTISDGDLVPAIMTALPIGMLGRQETMKPGGAGGVTEQWMAALAVADRVYAGIPGQFIMWRTSNPGTKAGGMGGWNDYSEAERAIYDNLGIVDPEQPITPGDLADFERTVVLSSITGARGKVDLPENLAKEVGMVIVTEDGVVTVKSLVIDREGRVFIAETEYVSDDIENTRLAMLARNDFHLPEVAGVREYAMAQLIASEIEEEDAVWLHRLESNRKSITPEQKAWLHVLLGLKEAGQEIVQARRIDEVIDGVVQGRLGLELDARGQTFLAVTEPLKGRALFAALEVTEQGRQAVTMATNIRTPLSLPGIIEAAIQTGSVVVFQQAMTELGYTWPEGYDPGNAHKFVEMVSEVCTRYGFLNYVPKGDHVTVRVDKAFLQDEAAQQTVLELFQEILGEQDVEAREAKFAAALDNEQYMQDANVVNAMAAIKKAYDLLKAEVDAGMTIFALDASFMPMRLNIVITAFLAGFIPEDCSIEAEVGEIGGERNSTIADALELITGIRYEEIVKTDLQTGALYSELVTDERGEPVVKYRGKGLLDYGVHPQKIAINNGTQHGLNYDADGNLIDTKMNLIETAAIARELEKYRITIVQHGVTGTPLENLPTLRAAGITEAHVGTHWQLIMWETLVSLSEGRPELVALVDDMINTLIEKYGGNYNVSDRETALEKDLERLIGKELKRILGQYKSRLALLPDDVKAAMTVATRESAVDYFKTFKSEGTAQLVRDQLAVVAQAAHLEPWAKFVDVAKAFSADPRVQERIIKALIDIGPAYKVVDGKVVKNPAVLAYLSELGVETSDEEGLMHEAAELTLAEAHDQGILTTEMLLRELYVKRQDRGLMMLALGYDREYGHHMTFAQDQGYALRHILAEVHDGGPVPLDIAVIARELYDFARGTLVEAGFGFKEFTKSDVTVLAEDSEELQASRQRIVMAEKEIAIAREDAAKQAARARDMATLAGVAPTKAMQGLRLEVLSALRKEIDNLGSIIAREDTAFYSNTGSGDITARNIENLTILFTAKDVIENLAGFKEQCLRMGNLPIFIVTLNQAERSQIERLRELGFLPKNIATKSHDRALPVLDSGKVIALGFRESFEAYDFRASTRQLIEFAELGEDEVLNWERVFAALAVTVLDEIPDATRTNMDREIMLRLSKGEGIDEFHVGVPVTKRLVGQAKLTYNLIKANI